MSSIMKYGLNTIDRKKSAKDRFLLETVSPGNSMDLQRLEPVSLSLVRLAAALFSSRTGACTPRSNQRDHRSEFRLSGVARPVRHVRANSGRIPRHRRVGNHELWLRVTE